jgi:hypothetical protein
VVQREDRSLVSWEGEQRKQEDKAGIAVEEVFQDRKTSRVNVFQKNLQGDGKEAE